MKEIHLVTTSQSGRGGAYVLRVELRRTTDLVFGRFKRGKSIRCPAGSYLYTGSAMAQQGSSCLAKRLLRHASRTQGRPHRIRSKMVKQFPLIGLADETIKPPTQKKFRWNIDHLLELETARLAAVYPVRSSVRMEPHIGDLLEVDPKTEIVEEGLGANDRPGSTYLLRLEAEKSWWSELPQRLLDLLIQTEKQVAEGRTV